MASTKHQSEDAPIKNYLIDEKLLSATQTMKILSVSRAKFYTKVVKDPDFTQIVKPLCLIHNGLKQYRQTEIIAFIERKQEVH
jgi:predicted DNA-binding transcriptional regulator AlpA